MYFVKILIHVNPVWTWCWNVISVTSMRRILEASMRLELYPSTLTYDFLNKQHVFPTILWDRQSSTTLRSSRFIGWHYSYSPLQTFPSLFTVWRHRFFWKPLKGLSNCSVRHNYVLQSVSPFICAVLLDLLGSGVFGFVQNDIRGNIGERFSFCPTLYQSLLSPATQGVRARYQADSCCSTLENLVIREASCEDRHGTGCLIRLTRYVRPLNQSNDLLITIVTFLVDWHSYVEVILPPSIQEGNWHGWISSSAYAEWPFCGATRVLQAFIRRSLKTSSYVFCTVISRRTSLHASLCLRLPDCSWRFRLLFGLRRIAMIFMPVFPKERPRRN
jgi:hypothetical protein